MTPEIDLSRLDHAEKDALILSLFGQLEVALARIGELEKRLDRGLKASILEVRLREGVVAYRRASKEEKDDILRRWTEIACEGGGDTVG